MNGGEGGVCAKHGRARARDIVSAALISFLYFDVFTSVRLPVILYHFNGTVNIRNI